MLLRALLFSGQLFSGQPDLTAVQLGIADHEIRLLAVADGTDLVQAAKLPGGVIGRGADGILARNTERNGTQHAVIDIRSGACDGPVGQAGDAALQEHGLAAQRILARPACRSSAARRR